MPAKLILLLMLLTRLTVAAPPQPIVAKTKIIKPSAWYQEQAALWQKELAAKPGNAASWLNYYMASRYGQQSSENLTAIASAMEAAVPNTYELLCVKAWQADNHAQSLNLLEQAYSLQPDNSATYASMFLEYEYAGNEAKRMEFSKKLFGSPQLSQALLHYSYNVLMSVEKNAVLFAEADHITLPVVVLQDVMNIRRDVKVLNLDMLLDPAYRDRKLRALNLSWSEPTGMLPAIEQKKALCTTLPAQNKNTAFYYTLTLGQENITAIKDHLYVVGLASQLSNTRLDNLSIIKENLENRFLLDYLTVNFDGESEAAAGKVLQTNYLVPMLMLHEHYIKSGDAKRAGRWENMVVKLAAESSKEALVQNILEGRKVAQPFVAYALDYKDLEDHVRYVKDRVYGYNAEVTNAQYNRFLKFLQDNNRTEQYEKYKPDLSQYTEPALSLMKSYHESPAATKKQKFFTDYPVVNISYDAAVAYCEWLTEQYNNTSGRKYKKVKFRLPSVNEWQIAAAALKDAKSWVLVENTAEVKIFEGDHDISKKYQVKTVSLADPDIMFPWFRYYNMRNSALNHQGCSLGNFKFPDGYKPCQRSKVNTADGFWLMAPVESYFPNDIGLYDVAGNVAEMTNERGKACGGSWNHPPEQSTIKSINEYTATSADVGFRIFMEVVAQ